MDDNLLRIFIAVTTFAVVVQAGILVGLYLAVRKSTAKMEALATRGDDQDSAHDRDRAEHAGGVASRRST